MSNLTQKVIQGLVEESDPKKFDWSRFATGYKFYVGPEPETNGHPSRDDINAYCFTFEITTRANDLSSWAVTQRGLVLDKKANEFIYEPFPSSRTKAFLRDCRFKSKELAFKALQKFLKTHEPTSGVWIKKQKRSKS